MPSAVPRSSRKKTVSHHGEGRREDDGSTDSLNRPSRNQPSARRGGTCCHGSKREYRRANDETTCLTMAVTQPAADGDEAGEGEQIRIDDPVRGNLRHTQVGTNRDKRHTDDSLVEHRQAQHTAHGGQDPPFAGSVVDKRHCLPWALPLDERHFAVGNMRHTAATRTSILTAIGAALRCSQEFNKIKETSGRVVTLDHRKPRAVQKEA